jgi:predicted MPP superfamily phosphohydrolase
LLVNESSSLGGITFHGLDEPRIGHPEMSRLIHPHPFTGSFHCLVSHSVEPVVAAFPESFPFQLSLCGHSHGGQIRIPGFGALLTSCRHWKRFEYGLYQHRACPSSMIVTAGIGCSRIPFRLFCQPEVVLVRFSPTR